MNQTRDHHDAPSWSALHGALYRHFSKDRSYSGPLGFEGFIACLLSAQTSQSFHVARGGSQPAGDAASQDLGTTLQAKLYGKRSRLNVTELVGDLVRVAERLPNLEVYVLATTQKPDANLLAALDSAAEREGIDVVPLDLSPSGSSRLGALMVQFWREVTAEFLEVGPEWTRWAEARCRETEVRAIVEDVGAELRESIESYRKVMARSKAQLEHRLFPQSRPLLGTSADPRRLVSREALLDSFDRWLAKRTWAPLWVKGEEGMGKSWATADWVRSRDLGCPVIWLDSNEWHGFRGFDALLDAMAKALTEPSVLPRQRQRIWRKLWARWPSPACLVVLDGANEGDASRALEAILRELQSQDDRVRQFRQRFRLVITSRPLPLIPSGVFQSCEMLAVGPFSDEELGRAVSAATGGELGFDDLPERALGAVRRPRYLELYLELRSLFGEHEEVSVEAILFKRLWQILDEQRSEFGFEPNEGVLVFGRLIEVTKPLAIGRVLEDRALLRDLMPDAKNALIQLQDAGWFEEVHLGRKSISQTHVQLAWALYFLYQAVSATELELPERVEALRTVQDPGLDDDLRSHALGAALEVSLFQLDGAAPVANAALFSTWLLSRNAVLEEPRLETILVRDPHAYLQSIELVWRLEEESYRERYAWRRLLAKPLCRQWAEEGPVCVVVGESLVEWLLRFEKVESFDAEDQSDWETARPWLGLVRLAVRVFGHRYEPQLVRSLCRSLAAVSRFGVGYRSLYDQVHFLMAFVMQWSFQEAALGPLEEIATNPESAPAEVEAAKALAQTFHLVELPEALTRETQSFPWEAEDSFQDRLRRGEQDLLRGFSPEEFCERGPSWGIAELAGDSEVSDLSKEDCEALIAGVRALVETGRVRDADGQRSSEDSVFESWLPWLARMRPEDWWRVVLSLASRQINLEYPQWSLQSFSVLGVLSEDSLAHGLERAVREADLPDGEQFRSNHGVLEFIRWLLHLEDKTRTLECLRHLGKRRQEALDYLHCRPNPWVIRWIMDEACFELADMWRVDATTEVEIKRWLFVQWPFVDRLSTERAHQWCREAARVEVPGEAWQWMIVDALTHLDHPEALALLLGESGVADVDDPEAQEKILNWAIRRGELDRLEREYPAFVDRLRPLLRGRFLLEQGRELAFRDWGKRYFRDQLDSYRSCSIPREGLPYRWNRKVLESWVDREPETFIQVTREVFDSAEIHLSGHDNGGFLDAVLILWQNLAPLDAASARTQVEWPRIPGSRWLVDGVPVQVESLWDLEQGRTPEHRVLRLQQLRACGSDKEVAQHALAARYNDSLEELETLGMVLLGDERQLERALGVSLLAWHPDGDRWVEPLIESDPSHWVRDHAKWAVQLCKRDRIARTLYCEGLAAPTWLEQQARFEMLLPHILPSFRHWPDAKTEINRLIEALEPRRRALWIDFVDAVQNRSNWQRIFGRDLDRYCRGDELKNCLEIGELRSPWARPPGGGRA